MDTLYCTPSGVYKTLVLVIMHSVASTFLTTTCTITYYTTTLTSCSKSAAAWFPIVLKSTLLSRTVTQQENNTKVQLMILTWIRDHISSQLRTSSNLQYNMLTMPTCTLWW